MSVAPMLASMPSIDATRHLDNPTEPALSRTTTSDHQTPEIFVLGNPADGIIAQRRELTRAVHELAQRQLKSHHSGILRFEPDRRSCSVERPIEGSAITTRRTQHRVKTIKKRAMRSRSRGDLRSGRVLAKKASTIGSEMVFFGKFQANRRSWDVLGCVPS